MPSFRFRDFAAGASRRRLPGSAFAGPSASPCTPPSLSPQSCRNLAASTPGPALHAGCHRHALPRSARARIPRRERRVAPGSAVAPPPRRQGHRSLPRASGRFARDAGRRLLQAPVVPRDLQSAALAGRRSPDAGRRETRASPARRKAADQAARPANGASVPRLPLRTRQPRPSAPPNKTCRKMRFPYFQHDNRHIVEYAFQRGPSWCLSTSQHPISCSSRTKHA